MDKTLQTIADFLTRDHDRIDGLISAFQRLPADSPRLREAFEGMSAALRRHIDWEERLVFPAFAEREGEEAAVTADGMRQQHLEILRLLRDLGDCPPGNADERRNREEAFIQTLAEHNEAEEKFVYPWIDGALAPEERAALVERMGPD